MLGKIATFTEEEELRQGDLLLSDARQNTGIPIVPIIANTILLISANSLPSLDEILNGDLN